MKLVTLLNIALGRDINVLTAAGIFNHDRGVTRASERAVLLVHYDLSPGTYLVDTTTGEFTRAFDRWMNQMGLYPVSDLHAEPPASDWILHEDDNGQFVVQRTTGDREDALYLATDVGDFPPRWWYLVEQQSNTLSLIATNVPNAPEVMMPSAASELVPVWMDMACEQGLVWAGTIKALPKPLHANG